ncbi:related to ribosomal [Lecanosticta acicola]|uniref:Large ribosomal subunit protein uL23m n=1 Tax=Lecanosticta acicola TaxID=111012 RepID=A0AAI8Z9H0_9PEZI|nr:related to ribosomal [Lecanosticta acicola]
MATGMIQRNFRTGGKELFLPNVIITLLRTDHLGPNYAKFRVPLHFSKLDLRDYLWHAYNVGTLNIRSYVKLSRVQSGKPGGQMPLIRRWHRPQSTKYMTVELVRPFVWPPEPESFSAWNKGETEQMNKTSKDVQKQQGQAAKTYINKDRAERMREQAKELLEGKVRWKAPIKGAEGVWIPRS